MKNNRLSRFIVVGVVALIGFIFSVIILVSNSGRIITDSSGFNNSIAKVDHFVSSPVRFFSNISNDISSLFNAYSENKKLKSDMEYYENQSVIINELEAENASLRESLSLKESHNEYSVLPAAVINRTSVSWFDELTVSLGSDSGVNENMLVISNGYLVGKVSQVNDDSSSVHLLTNTELSSEIPVKISSNGNTIFGLITTYDTENDFVVVTQLNSDAEVAVASEVVTSGLDGTTVSEVPVGEVRLVEGEGSDRKIYVKIGVDSSQLTNVSLVGKSNE